MNLRALCLCFLFPFLPATSQDGVNLVAKAQLNAQFASLWSGHGKALVQQKLSESLTGLSGKFFDQGNTKVWVHDVWGVESQLGPPPGFEKLSLSGIQARVPLWGTWKVQFKAKLKVKQKVAWFWITDNFTLTATASQIWARAKADLNSSDPEAPKVKKAYAPELHFDLSLSTDKWYLNVLLFLFKPLINYLLEKTVDDALDTLLPSLQQLEGEPKPFGTGGPGVGTTEPYDFKTPALKISQKIQQYHLPYKTLLSTNFQIPFLGTWEDSWGTEPGPVAGHTDWGDSAIWTGHALAAESFRYKLTGDAQSKELILTMLDGITQLANMRGVPGLLNRAVAPVSAAGQPTAPDYVLNWNGTPHVMYDFISRDQYMGVFFGMATAYDFVNHPQVKALCKQNIETMLDYLLTHKWVALRKDGTVSTVWQSNPAHQLAWVRAGRRVNPSKYYLTYWKHAYLSDICWFSPWTMTFDPVGSYFKFNLEHGAFYTFLRLESNPWVWQRGYKGFRILRKALAHHLQAHFNMCTVGIAPWQALQIGPETRTLLRLFLKRPRRHVNVSVSGVETVPYTPPGVESGLFGALDSNAPTGPSTISKYPLPPDKRPSTDFLWQRDSFRLSSWGDGTKEGPGVDYTLPYWMGRYYGVLAN